MGCCFSKKNEVSSSLNASQPILNTLKVDKNEIQNNNMMIVEDKEVKKQVVEEGSFVKKEIFVIKHRKSQDRDKRIPPPNLNIAPLEEDSPAPAATASAAEILSGNSNTNVGAHNMVLRTSSCTKEEVDAILIQCGRLSRSNSSGAGKPPSSGVKYSGSKRSYDFDNNNNNDQDQDVESSTSADHYDFRKKGNDEDDGEVTAERRQHRSRRRQSSRHSPSPSSQGRRRTPSRERDQNQRPSSRERGSGSSGRRVSRSPGRRSETTQNTGVTAGNANATVNANNTGGPSNRPGKMVSVPATVSSLVVDKSNNGVEPQATAGIRRISVKRNVGEAAVTCSRTVASPRSKSPARTNAKTSNENNQQPSLGRSNSRKADQSPYRRNPLSEIDLNSLQYSQPPDNKATCTSNNRAQIRNKDIEGQVVVKESFNLLNQTPMKKHNSEKNNRVNAQVTNCRGSSIVSLENKISKGQQMEEAKGQPTDMTTVVDLGVESLKPQTLTRSRSARRSRDLDLNPETLLNPTPSYTALLLEDIQNFHLKNTPSFSLPACVSKACSILEAVADLNSTTSSNLSCAFSYDRRSPPTVAAANLVGKKPPEAKDPFVESEVLASDDLMEPSFHKYVTVRRGGTLCGEDMDGQESSGSDSVAGGSQQHLGFSTSSWEPNSADSTDHWTSRSNWRDGDEKSPLRFQKHGLFETGRDVEQARRAFSGQRSGIGRGRLGTSKNLHSTAILASAAST
ncbi:hypothetical protein NC652_035644 [Populus alba x Populus x berolinensis]|uniref:Uncharacterized protein n=1 Tax=Populus tomentosa TaxID=118781 RepID=A0A8X8CAU4_POPTO|nr:hypothetical protein POTOM_049950 [Populus tomentosa]KAJ6876334.1 hypothetical protein NC652_035644 [Populus alba x Populus x berolinensis]